MINLPETENINTRRYVIIGVRSRFKNQSNIFIYTFQWPYVFNIATTSFVMIIIIYHVGTQCYTHSETRYVQTYCTQHSKLKYFFEFYYSLTY